MRGRLDLSEKRLSWRRLSPNVTSRGPYTSPIARCGTISRWFLSAMRFVVFASIAYSTCSCTMGQNSGIKAVLDSSENERRSLNSNLCCIRTTSAAH